MHILSDGCPVSRDTEPSAIPASSGHAAPKMHHAGSGAVVAQLPSVCTSSRSSNIYTSEDCISAQRPTFLFSLGQSMDRATTSNTHIAVSIQGESLPLQA